ncbi:MAG TPA: cytochrome c [Terriglobales bacterium]|nr:cytochrome c [Terriglobales bacterium]
MRKIMFIRSLFLAAAFLAISALGALAQKTEIKHVPMKQTSPASGQEMYTNYCASCHGKDGKGDGPAAAALKMPPADLTTLSKRNGGKFPNDHVAATLHGEAELPAHGSKEMPVWGPLFSQMSHGHPPEVQQRIANLISYIETLQAQ